MPPVRTNEPEFGGQVLTWLAELLRAGGTPFSQVTEEPGLPGPSGTRWPDIAIWFDRAAGTAFALWELKTPTTDCRDNALLEVAAEKARRIHVAFVVTWNMREAVIWRVPEQGPITAEHRILDYPAQPGISRVEDWLNAVYRNQLHDRCRAILNDLVNLQRRGDTPEVQVDATFFVRALQDGVRELAPHVENALATAGRDLSRRLAAWATRQGLPHGDAPGRRVLSMHLVYLLICRLLFYKTAERILLARLPTLDLNGVPTRRVMQRIREYFAQARQFDWQSVFEPDLPDEIPLSEQAARILVGIVETLRNRNFSSLPEDIIGKVFEKLIPEDQRHDLGQYYTPIDLVDLILAFCVQHQDDAVLDPTCGTGTFLTRAYDRKKYLGQHDHAENLYTLWGVDVGAFPSALATINLYRKDLSDFWRFPRVLRQDFFKVRLYCPSYFRTTPSCTFALRAA